MPVPNPWPARAPTGPARWPRRSRSLTLPLTCQCFPPGSPPGPCCARARPCGPMAKQTDLVSSHASAMPLARAGSCPLAKQPDLASSHAAASAILAPGGPGRPGPAAPAGAPAAAPQAARWLCRPTLPAHTPVPHPWPFPNLNPFPSSRWRTEQQLAHSQSTPGRAAAAAGEAASSSSSSSHSKFEHSSRAAGTNDDSCPAVSVHDRGSSPLVTSSRGEYI